MVKQAKRQEQRAAVAAAEAERFYKTRASVPGPVSAQTAKQKIYMAAIASSDLIFGTGEAGSGKTYVATALACAELVAKRIDKIIVTRPAQEAGESMGFLPGELNEKFAPYLRPLEDVFVERLGKSRYEYFVKARQIEAIPLAYMRGMTFARCWVLVDEAQNATPRQMQMLLTRIGQDCKVIVDGDPEQSDIKGLCGLSDALATVRELPGVAHVHFEAADVVRSGLCQAVVKAYARRRGQIQAA